MALTHDLPIYRDVYKLILQVFNFTKDFPREYKYTLGQDMKRYAIVLVRSIYRANRSLDKKQYLEEFLDCFEILKLEIRLSVDMKILAVKKQAELSALLDSIGKQATGWKNAVKV
ncbi:MAG: four helix bundle protein [bacterium]